MCGRLKRQVVTRRSISTFLIRSQTSRFFCPHSFSLILYLSSPPLPIPITGSRSITHVESAKYCTYCSSTVDCKANPKILWVKSILDWASTLLQTSDFKSSTDVTGTLYYNVEYKYTLGLYISKLSTMKKQKQDYIILKCKNISLGMFWIETHHLLELIVVINF